jgi:hypothetical protein
MKCEYCNKDVYSIHIDKNHNKLYNKCYCFENRREIPKILKIDKDKFEKCKSNMFLEYGFKVSDNEKTAMSVVLKDKSFILINKDEYDEYDEDYQYIIIAHECAHCCGIKGEEDADKWALEVMKKSPDKSKAVKKLLDMWKYRHGHEYKK